MKDMGTDINKLTEKIIGAVIEVHRHLGPGLLESTYEACLVYELEQRGLHREGDKEKMGRRDSQRSGDSQRKKRRFNPASIDLAILQISYKYLPLSSSSPRNSA